MSKKYYKALVALIATVMLSSTTYGVTQASTVNTTNTQLTSNVNRSFNNNLVSNDKVFNRKPKLTLQDQQKDQQIAKIMAQFAQERQKEYYPNIAINARTLAGYKTANGKYEIKSNKLFRSNNLHNLDFNGENQLHKLHVNRIIDLRDTPQVRKMPDPNEKIPNTDLYFTDDANPDIKVVDLPIYSHREQKMNRAKIHEFGEAYAYKTMLSTDKRARKNYSKALKIILHHKHGAVLYHCIEGRDRTGILSVILLSALGVKRSDIYKDYLLTDFYNHKHPYVEQYRQLNAFFNTINTRYGGMRSYLHKLGLNNKNIRTLRKEYLVRTK